MKQASKILLALLSAGVGACASDAVSVEVRTSPVGATLYVNGVKQGLSNRRVTFDFSECERNYLQVVMPGRPVVTEYYTRDQLPEDDEPILITIGR